MSEEEEEEGDEVGEDDVETEADLLEGDIAVAEVTYRQPCNNFLKLFLANCWHCRGKIVLRTISPFYSL